ncbi:hypothetical protein B484DRAFT_463308 [Ochromonadaceae sp. CCMP2298]|nr:hypothetical protein B484DRAFT_463308 [Ochromonadaceae sp. CCMP2298]
MSATHQKRPVSLLELSKFVVNRHKHKRSFNQIENIGASKEQEIKDINTMLPSFKRNKITKSSHESYMKAILLRSEELLELKEGLEGGLDGGQINTQQLLNSSQISNDFWAAFGISQPGLKSETIFQKTPSPELTYKLEIVGNLVALARDQRPCVETPPDLQLADLDDAACTGHLHLSEIRSIQTDLMATEEEEARDEQQSVKKRKTEEAQAKKDKNKPNPQRDASEAAERAAKRESAKSSAAAGAGAGSMEDGLAVMMTAQAAAAQQQQNYLQQQQAKEERRELLIGLWASLHNASALGAGVSIGQMNDLLRDAGILEASDLKYQKGENLAACGSLLKEAQAAKLLDTLAT